jgi:hypothetical protein
MANGGMPKQFINWAIAGMGLIAGAVVMKTAINLVRGIVPLPIADV